MLKGWSWGMAVSPMSVEVTGMEARSASVKHLRTRPRNHNTAADPQDGPPGGVDHAHGRLHVSVEVGRNGLASRRVRARP